MCLIIQTEKPSNLKRDLLECAYQSNSDGFGVMFYNGGKIHTHKIVPKTFQDIEKVTLPLAYGMPGQFPNRFAILKTEDAFIKK